MREVRVRNLVGRVRETALLSAELDSALGGRGALVLVSGDGGIGKTALAEDLCTRAALAGADVLWGRCLEGEGAPPFWPWVQILRELDPDLARRNPRDESQESRFALFEAAVALLKSTAADKGAVVVLDDLHWADQPSLLLLRFLASELADSRLLVIANYRESEFDPQGALARALPDLRRERVARSVHLEGLDEPEVAELVATLTGDQFSRATSRNVFVRAEGNPFFVGEIVRLLGAEGGEQVPEGIRQVLRRRTNLLSPACHGLLEAASVIGREFSLKALESITASSRAELLDGMDEAVRARVVSETAGTAGRFHFNHALIRETLYEDLSMSRRVELHRRAGEALEKLVAHEIDTHLNELATHFFKASPAGDAAKAMDYASRAADYAMSRFAFEEAARLYRMALDALDQLGPDDVTRARLLLSLARAQDLSDEAAAGLATSLELVRVARRLGDKELAAQAALVTEAVMTLGVESENIVTLCTQAMEALGNSNEALRARLLAQLAMAMHFREPRHSESLARESLEAAERSGDAVALAAALNAGQNLQWGTRTPADKIRAGERLVELGLETGTRKAELWGHFWRIAGFFENADMRSLEPAIEAYGRVAEEIRDPSARWRTAISRAVLTMMAGRFEEAERRAAEIKATGLPNQIQVVRVMQGALLANLLRPQGRLSEVVTLMERAALAGPNSTVRSIRLCALAGLGSLDEARSEFEQMTVPDLRTQERPHTWPINLVHLAEASIALGNQRQSEIIYELLAPYPDQNAVAASGTAANYGSISRYLGLLAASLGRLDNAVEHYESAIAMNERQASLPYLAYSQYELAETLVRRGRPGDKARAQPLLARSLESAKRMGMPPLVERAEALLAKVGGSGRQGPLTAREAEIAVLVAGGLSNKQIAERLHISVRTAENHVENICNKLGFGSRAQIAAWATEKGLR